MAAVIHRLVLSLCELAGLAMGFLSALFGGKLAYRAKLQAAAQRGDTRYIAGEIEKNQLTPDELARLRERHTPIEQWPDHEGDDDLLDESALQSEPPQHCEDPGVRQ